ASGTQVSHSFPAVGHVTISATATDQGGNVSAPVTQGVTVTVPQVQNVLVDGTNWTAPFLAELQTASLGNGNGYAIPVGSSDQLKTLPWTNLNQIQVVFSDDVNVQASDLSLTGINVAQYGFSDFKYDHTSFTATWTLGATITTDKLTLSLDGHS